MKIKANRGVIWMAATVVKGGTSSNERRVKGGGKLQHLQRAVWSSEVNYTSLERGRSFPWGDLSPN